MGSIERTILAVLREIASQRRPDLPPLERGQTLAYDLGLGSMDLAQMVSTLEMELAADPFARLVPITSVRTVGDVCEAYRRYFEEKMPGSLDPLAGDGGGRLATRLRVPDPASAESRRRARGCEPT